jgi:hypothetical protein
LATHVLTVWSQQAPPPHQSPSQHGWPLPPQAAHLFVVASQASPEVVQKLALVPSPGGAPAQHGSPSPPHVPHAELAQTPSGGVPPQLWPWLTQTPSTQQRFPPHVALWQQGWVGPPHATTFPSMHTSEVDGDSPRAKQAPPEQHPPPWHAVAPAQQG